MADEPSDKPAPGEDGKAARPEDAPTGRGLCPFSATSAAVDQAIFDGVDVLNYSISGGLDPWNTSDIDSFFLNAVAAGIFVSASAGNAGPTAGTVAHLGPWMTTVAASNHDGVQHDSNLVSLSGGTTALMPFYGSTPAEAAELLIGWLTRAHRVTSNSV